MNTVCNSFLQAVCHLCTDSFAAQIVSQALPAALHAHTHTIKEQREQSPAERFTGRLSGQASPTRKERMEPPRTEVTRLSTLHVSKYQMVLNIERGNSRRSSSSSSIRRIQMKCVA